MEEAVVDKYVSVPRRNSQHTTKQMLAAPIGAVYVWCNDRLHYPKSLAETLGRTDLEIKPLSWLRHDNLAGRKLSGIVLDHACEMDNQTRDAFMYAQTRVY
jgi:hypothetical protein